MFFIFNIPSCFPVTDVPYDLFENLQDAKAISSKYDSKTLTFKTPNIVRIFSNKVPDRFKMSKDRWRMFFIEGDDLIAKD